MNIKAGYSAYYSRLDVAVFTFTFDAEDRERVFRVSCYGGKYEVNEFKFGDGESEWVRV